ncbi:cytochrome C oxidase subunit IV family protein [Caldalkalibacillus mannanilyticus]|uniref:cytochrome C oxidase subunit IV family protein n=1 Tax=Caldalkalibacillus mannanilyticus TaxID=1418 RepID=UPI0004688260|nr:cytochrome C oxidase subunit IV family protein [Caldalkalibacillus mannanilyticus]
MDQQDDVMSSHKAKHYGLEFRRQWWSYFVSIALTVLAFLAVGWNVFQSSFSILMFLILLAVIQIAFQLFFFMHLKEKGHFFPLTFILAGVLFAIVIVIGINLWLWW